MRYLFATRRVLVGLTVAVVIGLVGATSALALFNNGGFEAGDFSGWQVDPLLNPGLRGVEPFSGASMALVRGGTNTSTVLGGAGVAPLSMTDPVVSDIHFPRFGSYVARVGDTTVNLNTNIISQSVTIASTDVDPFDQKVHARFAFLPVLENPGHPPAEQPFFYFALRNIDPAKGSDKLVYEKFIFSAQPGIPWRSSGGTLYTDWQVVDVVIGDRSVVGTQLLAVAIAAGCSQAGHYGYAYIDGFGAFLPGLFVTKTAPGTVFPGQLLTYSFVARNTGTAAIDNVVLTERVPDQTAFVSVSDKRCQESGGVLTCALGRLASGAGVSFKMTVRVGAAASGTITNGDYQIAGAGYPALLGQAVTTKVQDPTSITLARFAATREDGRVLLDWSTSAEVQSLGFHVYRSATGLWADAERITPALIPAKGAGGGSYQWADVTALPDAIYHYWLEETTTSGALHEYGPVFTAPSPFLKLRIFVPLALR